MPAHQKLPFVKAPRIISIFCNLSPGGPGHSGVVWNVRVGLCLILMFCLFHFCKGISLRFGVCPSSQPKPKGLLKLYESTEHAKRFEKLCLHLHACVGITLK